jgi:ribosomal protein S18 acetylase RimI-like enzyme
MDFTIRRARREDCAEIMELIRELAIFERAPDEVTATLEHFEESGFGNHPVWWAFVACAPVPGTTAAGSEKEETKTRVEAELSAENIAGQTEPAMSTDMLQPAAGYRVAPFIQLEEPLNPEAAEPAKKMLSLMPEALPCERIIGFALYYIRYSTWKGQRMYLEDLLVTESWRCRGVGTALMDALIAAAKAEGLHGISWQVLEWNEPAIAFYKRYQARFAPEWVNVAIDV